MMKKLVIKFWRSKTALAMQIVEQTGNFVGCGGKVILRPTPVLVSYYNKEKRIERVGILDGSEPNRFDIDSVSFSTEEERDDYLYNITKAITNELFSPKVKASIDLGFEILTYTWIE